MNGEFIYGLFNDAVSNTDCAALNGRTTAEMNRNTRIYGWKQL
jgi:hypothetical protein